MQSILGNTRKTDMTFHPDGRIDISARVSRELSLQRGDVIDVLDCGNELYLYVKFRAPVSGRHEAACFPSKTGGKHFRTWSKRLCLAMMRKCGAPDGVLRLPLGTMDCINGTDVLPIIYKAIIEKHDIDGNNGKNH
ncbi:MAG TPA: hypothetical protein IAA99_03780 [Candidatus Avibacteroides faecavium]|nr:hypothetical protein [Candidatus Avibacteroides faecavium]